MKNFRVTVPMIRRAYHTPGSAVETVCNSILQIAVLVTQADECWLLGRMAGLAAEYERANVDSPYRALQPHIIARAAEGDQIS